MARKNFRLWQQNPNHPSLRFRQLSGRNNLYSVRVGEHYRALGVGTGDQIVWVWIGSHAEYDRLVGT